MYGTGSAILAESYRDNPPIVHVTDRERRHLRADEVARLAALRAWLFNIVDAERDAELAARHYVLPRPRQRYSQATVVQWGVEMAELEDKVAAAVEVSSGVSDR